MCLLQFENRTEEVQLNLLQVKFFHFFLPFFTIFYNCILMCNFHNVKITTCNLY